MAGREVTPPRASGSTSFCVPVARSKTRSEAVTHADWHARNSTPRARWSGHMFTMP
ncbi:MAG: hypothetical protein IPK12_19310 [Gemmatimonadetes bacterium]|nr:hypothetical protein [Gemmatimonadota bacterium]